LIPVFVQSLLGYTAVQAGLALMPRALVMFVLTPIVGRLYNKIQPRFVVAFGVLCFATSTWFMSHYTLLTSTRQLILPLLIQGAGFACLFVPLTTVALTSIERRRLPDATGLNSLMRQIGGSIGLAVFATLMTRYLVQIKAALASHVSVGRPEVMQRLDQVTATLVSRGLDPTSAALAAKRALGGVVMQQANVMLFEKLFLLTGIAFLFVLPLLYFLKAPDKASAPKIDVHVEM
jgi:DHA2 family multidrug resistance protein